MRRITAEGEFMGKQRLSDEFEFDQKQQRALRRNRLVIYPLITFLLAFIAILPPVLALIGGGRLSIIMIVTGLAGLFMLYKGISMLVRNRGN